MSARAAFALPLIALALAGSCPESLAVCAELQAAEASQGGISDEDLLRLMSDLSLGKAIDELAHAKSALAADDPAFATLCSIATARMRLRDPKSTSVQRARAMVELRELRAKLAAQSPDDGRLPLWLGEAAEDELLLGFLSVDCGGVAIAGSQVTDDGANAQESLDRVQSWLTMAQRADRAAQERGALRGPQVQESQIDQSRTARAMLADAVEAFSMIVGPGGRSPAESARIAARGKEVLAHLEGLRSGLPPRLIWVCDLAEAAAAATAAQPEVARLAAARLAQAGDELAFVLGRIFWAQALINARRGSDAIAVLEPLAGAQGLSTAVRVIGADSLVHARIALGRPATTDTTLAPWTDLLRHASSESRPALRRTLLERVDRIVARSAPVGTPAAIASIAIARRRLLADARDEAASATLGEIAKDAHNPQIQAIACLAALDIHTHHGNIPAAVDDLVAFAKALPRDPAAPAAAQLAVDMELAIAARDTPWRARQAIDTIEWAIGAFPSLEATDASRVALLALRQREQLAEEFAGLPGPSEQFAKELAGSVAKLEHLAQTAQVSTGGSGLVADTLLLMRTAVEMVGEGRDGTTVSGAEPSAAQWGSLSLRDASLLARMRLECAARHGREGPSGFDGVLRAIPANLGEVVLTYLREKLEAATTSASAPGGSGARSLARRALDACTSWEAISPTNLDPVLLEARQRLAADLAVAAEEWPEAARRSRELAAGSRPSSADMCRALTALRGLVRPGGSALDPTELARTRLDLVQLARDVGKASPRGSSAWWQAQVSQLQVAQDSGRGGEACCAKIARLRAMDPQLGSPACKREIETILAAALAQ